MADENSEKKHDWKAPGEPEQSEDTNAEENRQEPKPRSAFWDKVPMKPAGEGVATSAPETDRSAQSDWKEPPKTEARPIPAFREVHPAPEPQPAIQSVPEAPMEETEPSPQPAIQEVPAPSPEPVIPAYPEPAPMPGPEAAYTEGQEHRAGEGKTGPASITEGITSKSMMAAIKGMVSFFTIIPLDVNEDEMDAMDRNMHFAPVIGFLVGLVVMAAAGILVLAGFGTITAVAVSLALLLMLTKFLHFDGLVDFGDGMIASGSTEKRVHAMKDSSMGAGGFGVALTITLISFAAFVDMGLFFLALVWPVEVLTRNAMVAAAAFGEPGSGMAGRQVSFTSTKSMMISTIVAVILAVVAVVVSVIMMAAVGGFVANPLLVRYIAVVIVMAVISVAVGWGMAKIANKGFGMVNGDVLGATNEISRAAMLLVSMLMLALMF
ncbi:MAG: adenosylcobinamide-GDP ribazoletransferase [Candidatus Methanomethylophilaceae archaeon]|nr:adenosylcobinamide-GDP ribazoletransferase [Candidatus Methanomethylophilaceae archaeon]NLF33928.1 adenosylcobinamide-GDP ribazoletransferase [Thermoplasmatales archaeon]